MKFNIKKLSKILTVFLLVFLTSLEALTFTASAEIQSRGPCPTMDEEYVYLCDGSKYYRKKHGERINQYDVKEYNTYIIASPSGCSEHPVYVTRVYEDPTWGGFVGTQRAIEGINLETGNLQTWGIGDNELAFLPQRRVYAMIRADIDDIISCRGISYYKYKRGEAVGEYDVEEGASYLINSSSNSYDLRIYVKKVFDDPHCWGVFGLTRKVEGIDLDTGENKVVTISKDRDDKCLITKEGNLCAIDDVVVDRGDKCLGIYKMINVQS